MHWDLTARRDAKAHTAALAIADFNKRSFETNENGAAMDAKPTLGNERSRENLVASMKEAENRHDGGFPGTERAVEPLSHGYATLLSGKVAPAELRILCRSKRDYHVIGLGVIYRNDAL